MWGYVATGPGRGLGDWCWESLPGKGLLEDDALLLVLESAKFLFVTQTQGLFLKE